MLVEDAKEMRKVRREYEAYCRQFTGVIMNCLGVAMDRLVRIHVKFSEAYAENDVLALWRIIKSICTKDAVEDLDEAKYLLWNIRQGTRSFNEYVLDIEQKMRVLLDGKVDISQPDLINIFIMGLDVKTFREKVADIKTKKNSSEYPSDYVAAKELFRVWSMMRHRSEGEFERSGKEAESTVFAVETRSNKKIECWHCHGNHFVRKCPLLEKKKKAEDVQAAYIEDDFKYIIG
jgi:flagellar biosynthesis chaperone FliJ